MDFGEIFLEVQISFIWTFRWHQIQNFAQVFWFFAFLTPPNSAELVLKRKWPHVFVFRSSIYPLQPPKITKFTHTHPTHTTSHTRSKAHQLTHADPAATISTPDGAPTSRAGTTDNPTTTTHDTRTSTHTRACGRGVRNAQVLIPQSARARPDPKLER